MSFSLILFIFVGFRTLDLIISFFSPLIPYLGFFPYKEILDNYHLPQFVRSMANFDGVLYLLIAKNGYTTYEQAFFPLYPLLIKLFWPVLYKTNLLVGFVSAFIITNVSFLVGLHLFNKYLQLMIKNKQSLKWSLIFLLTFPPSFFFGAIYTEGLFFLLFISCLFFLKKERYYLAAISAFFAALTRFIGIFLIIPLFFSFILKSKVLKFKSRWLFILLSPLFGLASYSLYLWKTTGDPLFFLNSQWAFGAYRRSNLILLPQVYYRYLKIFFTANWNFQYFISLFEFVIFSIVFVILILDLIRNWKPARSAVGLENRNFERLGLNLFSFVNLLLPTLTGTLSSIPRYALFSLSFFIYLAQIKNVKLKVAVAFIFFILHVVMLSFFVQGYFVS